MSRLTTKQRRARTRRRAMSRLEWAVAHRFDYAPAVIIWKYPQYQGRIVWKS